MAIKFGRPIEMRDAPRPQTALSPASLDLIAPGTVVEALGQDVGQNTLRTDHIDLFEGTDRTLVQPTFVSILPDNRVVAIDPGFDRFLNGFNIGAQSLLYGWAYPVETFPGTANGTLGRLHVVGNAIGGNAFLRVSIHGTNFATTATGDTVHFGAAAAVIQTASTSPCAAWTSTTPATVPARRSS